MNEEIRLLKSIHAALNQLETRGKENCAIVVACMNDIERVVKSLDEKEADNGNIHAES